MCALRVQCTSVWATPISGAQQPHAVSSHHTGQCRSGLSTLGLSLLYFILKLEIQLHCPGNRLHLFGRLGQEGGRLQQRVLAQNPAQAVRQENGLKLVKCVAH